MLGTLLARSAVLLPSKITLLSNAILLRLVSAVVLLPSKITLLSNWQRDYRRDFEFYYPLK